MTRMEKYRPLREKLKQDSLEIELLLELCKVQELLIELLENN